MEIVALDRGGKPSFAPSVIVNAKVPLSSTPFDLLYFDGEDVSQYPLVGRKESLRRILRKAPRARIRYTEHVEAEGERIFTQLEAMQLEGMVCKRKDGALKCRSGLKLGASS